VFFRLSSQIIKISSRGRWSLSMELYLGNSACLSFRKKKSEKRKGKEKGKEKRSS